MNNLNIKFLIISCIVGITLGAITEYALILNLEYLIKITQSFIFWGIVMFVISLCSKHYITSILAPAITMTSMNATYYLIRLFMSGYTNIGAWELYSLLGIAASFYIGTFIYCIKEKISNKNIKNYIPKVSLILMTISAIIFTSIHIYGLYNSVIIFGNYLYQSTIIGIILGMLLGIVVGMYLNKKRKVKFED